MAAWRKAQQIAAREAQRAGPPTAAADDAMPLAVFLRSCGIGAPKVAALAQQLQAEEIWCVADLMEMDDLKGDLGGIGVKLGFRNKISKAVLARKQQNGNPQ